MAEGIIQIGIADDQAMFRSGLVSMLHENPHVRVMIEASDGKEMISKLKHVSVDLVLLDFRMPELNGIEATRIIRKEYPKMGVLILSMYDDQEFVVSALENGANGYLCKDDSPEEINNAIESVLSTGYFINDRTSKILIQNLVQSGKVNPVFKDAQSGVRFTNEELTVFKLISEEKSNKEIAEIMGKAERTVEGYKTSIMQKTGTKNSAGIVMYGVRNRIIIV